MAYFIVRNSMNPNKAVTFGITYRQIIDKSSQDGEAIWVVEIATDEPHVTTSGTIPPYFITITDSIDLDSEIEKGVVYLSNQINWQPLILDTRPPFVTEITPANYEASIRSNVIVKITDIHPSAGIDIDSIKLLINEIDVTDELIYRGDEFEYEIEWRPPRRIYEQI